MTAPRKTAPKTPARRAPKAAPAKAPAGRTGRTPTKNTTATKTASPKATTTERPITQVTHDQAQGSCGKTFKPSDGILEALNLGQWTDRGIDCPMCMAYRPLSDYTMVRG